MTNKPGIFYFAFRFQQDEEALVLAFTIAPHAVEQLNGLNEACQSEWYEEVMDDLASEYGVHDWSSRPSDDVDAIGYTTYEVESADRAMELVERWRRAFAQRVGADGVSATVSRIEITESMRDADIHRAARDAALQAPSSPSLGI